MRKLLFDLNVLFASSKTFVFVTISKLWIMKIMSMKNKTEFECEENKFPIAETKHLLEFMLSNYFTSRPSFWLSFVRLFIHIVYLALTILRSYYFRMYLYYYIYSILGSIDTSAFKLQAKPTNRITRKTWCIRYTYIIYICY